MTNRLSIIVLTIFLTCSYSIAVRAQNNKIVAANENICGEFKVHDKNSRVWKELQEYYKKTSEAIINKDLETTLKFRELLIIETPDGKRREGAEVAESTKAQFKLNQQILNISNTI